MRYFYSETTIVKCIHACIIHRKIIVIELKAIEKMDIEEHTALFQCRISAVRLVRSDLSLVIFKTRTCLLALSFFKHSTILVPSWPRFEKR